MKKAVLESLASLEARLATAGQRDITQIPRGERHEIIKGHAITWLSGLDDAERVRAVDAATLLHVNGGGYRSSESRSGLEQAYGPELSDWPVEVKDRYIRNMIVSWLADLEPSELRAVDEAAKEGAGRH